MYTFTLTEHELDLVLAALGNFAEEEATALMVRLDNGATQQEDFFYSKAAGCRIKLNDA